MSGEDELLTTEDFGYCASDIAACGTCHADTTTIFRDNKRKYVAVFSCDNAKCPNCASDWYKCRVCSNLPISSKRLTQHVKNKGHEERVAAFESMKSKTSPGYVLRESLVVGELDGAFNTSETIASHASIPPEWLLDADDEAPCSHYVDWDSSHATGESSPNHQNNDPVTTVETWIEHLSSKSPGIPDDTFAKYFPTELEQSPNADYKRVMTNQDYFMCNRQFSHGPRFLTTCAVMGNMSPSETMIEQYSPTHTLWCVLLAKLTDRLTATEQQMFVALLAHAQNSNSDSLLPSTMSERHQRDPLPMPKDPAALRRLYGSGRKSIPNLLPRPPIQISELENGFVYVSIRDILQFHLANGQALDPLVDLPYAGGIPSLHGSSPRGKYLLSAPFGNVSSSCFPTEVVIWSDGFEANNTKNNRGSVHVLLVSIGTPQQDYHSGCNTYPVWLGPANGDMSAVTNLVVEDLKELSNTSHDGRNKFYDAASQTELAISSRVYCFLQDRPERCHWLRLAYGNGKYAARIGWAGNLFQSETFNFLPSCSSCNELRLQEVQWTGSGCGNRCGDWCMDGLCYKVPKNYPTVFRSNSDRAGNALIDPRVNGTHLLFRKISIQDLKDASDVTFDMVRLRIWSKNNGMAYLETFALSPDYVSEICDAAIGSKEDQRPPLQEDQPSYPATWNIPGVDICDHIDVVMHLCFLGITKANSSSLIDSWLKGARKSKAFYKKSKTVLKAIKDMRLSWCKAETTFGGYVSENWVAYCLVSKYIHQLLTAIAADKADKMYEDPVGLPLYRYNLTQKRAWLRARRIEGITKSSTRVIVNEKFSPFESLLPEQLPAIVESPVSKASLEQVNDLVAYWQALVARIMSMDQNPTNGQILDIERHIKLFLTTVEAFDSSRREQQGLSKEMKVPVWRRKPNYLGLLNYPETIRTMGPLSPLSELDYKGEASIKHIKSKINHGLNGNWAFNAMLGYYRERSFRYVLKDCVNDVTTHYNGHFPTDDGTSLMTKVATQIAGKSLLTGTSEGKLQTRGRNYKTFKQKQNAVDSISAKNVVSGVVIDGCFYLVVKEDEIETGVEITPLLSFHTEVCGAHYFSYAAVASSGGSADGCDVSTATEFFLLLPLLSKKGTFTPDRTLEADLIHSFYLITSKWREVVRSKNDEVELQLPRNRRAVY